MSYETRDQMMLTFIAHSATGCPLSFALKTEKPASTAFTKMIVPRPMTKDKIVD